MVVPSFIVTASGALADTRPELMIGITGFTFTQPPFEASMSGAWPTSCVPLGALKLSNTRTSVLFGDTMDEPLVPFSAVAVTVTGNVTPWITAAAAKKLFAASVAADAALIVQLNCAFGTTIPLES